MTLEAGELMITGTLTQDPQQQPGGVVVVVASTQKQFRDLPNVARLGVTYYVRCLLVGDLAMRALAHLRRHDTVLGLGSLPHGADNANVATLNLRDLGPSMRHTEATITRPERRTP